MIVQNTVDLSYALRELAAAGHPIQREDVAALSPYWTQHIKRFGDYVLEWDEVPPVLEEELPIPV